MEETKSNVEQDSTLSSNVLHLPVLENEENTMWCSDTVLSKGYESTLPLPSFTVTAPPFDNTTESKFSYFPRKFSFQAFRKLSGSSVSLCRFKKIS